MASLFYFLDLWRTIAETFHRVIPKVLFDAAKAPLHLFVIPVWNCRVLHNGCRLLAFKKCREKKIECFFSAFFFLFCTIEKSLTLILYQLIMEHIDSNQLYADGAYRFQYVAKFLEFGDEDIKAIEAVADKVRPLVPVVVDAVYDKLFKFDVTKKHFVPKNEGFEGPAPVSLEELTLDHPQIKFRKDFLSKYLYKILSGPYDDRFLRYLDWVAKIHTDTPSKKSKINVDYIHINALMGYVESVLAGGLLSLNLDKETESKALLAFNKLLWIQNDYFAKYYCNPDTIHDASVTKKTNASVCNCLKAVTTPAAILPLAIGAIAGFIGAYYRFNQK
ncbi:Protoglobin-domain-containing protein [Mycotypha africana]|uniref:Protoglobin-domain-containing protein n=1 Tax=Mycotypha africana TaxID=64632 RepID=UPI0022FFD0AE|nr:Protoglobin-domain-containing protein [Mycotypha africana]KAI8979749.1 Protoglobin-domain-containing protein [Mycotypha africana]